MAETHLGPVFPVVELAFLPTGLDCSAPLNLTNISLAELTGSIKMSLRKHLTLQQCGLMAEI